MDIGKLTNLALVLMFTISIASCASVSEDEDLPSWINEIQSSSQRLGSVSKHIINGEIYWYFDNSAICCDMASRVYDESGKYVCAKGGFGGPKSGNCPEHIKLYFDTYGMYIKQSD